MPWGWDKLYDGFYTMEELYIREKLQESQHSPLFLDRLIRLTQSMRLTHYETYDEVDKIHEVDKVHGMHQIDSVHTLGEDTVEGIKVRISR